MLKECSVLNGVDLNEVVSKFSKKDYIHSLDELIEADNNGDVVVFEDKSSCFWWLNDSEFAMQTTLEDIINLKGSDIGNKTVLDYMLDSENIVLLDNGRVVFIYN